MKRYILEMIILVGQILLFYVLPLFAGPTDGIGMVLLMILATLVLSYLLGALSNKYVKFLYPFMTAAIFVPTVYLYYNESAMVHAIWYLVVSLIGLIVGVITRSSFTKNKKKQ